MAARPFQGGGLLLGDAGEPQPGAAIGRRRDPPALRVEGHVGHRLLMGETAGERRVLGVDLISEALQLEVVDDALLQQAGEIGGRRYAKAGPHLFSDGAAADELTALKHEHSLPCPGGGWPGGR